MLAMNKLQAFLTARGIKQADFAASIGTTQSMVSRLINGAATPSLTLAAKIERATAGEVSASSWIPISEPADKPDQGEAA